MFRTKEQKVNWAVAVIGIGLGTTMFYFTQSWPIPDNIAQYVTP